MACGERRWALVVGEVPDGVFVGLGEADHGWQLCLKSQSLVGILEVVRAFRGRDASDD